MAGSAGISPATVFLSHSTGDRRHAFDLAYQLQAEGECRVWMGETAIGLGQNYADEIVRSIRECDVFVLLMSRSSLTSPNVRREVSIATSHDKLLLPVALEPGLLDDPEIQDHWRYWLQTAQTTQWTDAAAVATEIRRCLGGSLHVPVAAQSSGLMPLPEAFAQTAGAARKPGGRRRAILLVGAFVVTVVAALGGAAAMGWFSTLRSTTGSSASTAPEGDSPGPADAASPSPTVTQTHGSVMLVPTQRDTWLGVSVGHCADNSESVTVVKCTERHELEIFAMAKVVNKTLPPDSELEIAVDEFCVAAYPGYMEDPTDRVGPELYPLWPSKETWTEGDRAIWCTVETVPAVKGSIRDR